MSVVWIRLRPAHEIHQHPRREDASFPEGKRNPVKVGGLKARTPVPDDFNTMFEKEIEALFGGTVSAPKPERKRR